MTQDIQKMWMTEFRPRAFRTASEGIVEIWDYGIENCANKRGESDNGKNQGLRYRVGTRSSRSNCTSSKEAATPYHPGMDAGS